MFNVVYRLYDIMSLYRWQRTDSHSKTMIVK